MGDFPMLTRITLYFKSVATLFVLFNLIIALTIIILQYTDPIPNYKLNQLPIKSLVAMFELSYLVTALSITMYEPPEQST